jgi:hypothetical protein
MVTISVALSMRSVSKNESVSHEAICVLNTSDKDATINLTLFYEDREKIEGEFVSFCKAGRTHHIRLDRIVGKTGQKIAKDTPYAMLVESDVEVVCQYSRLDTSEVEMALMTTVAYPVE